LILPDDTDKHPGQFWDNLYAILYSYAVWYFMGERIEHKCEAVVGRKTDGREK
jgi:hypothetical protein